jgi:hypothetical protein
MYQLETVPMQLQRMDVVAGSAELQSVAVTFMHGLHPL